MSKLSLFYVFTILFIALILSFTLPAHSATFMRVGNEIYVAGDIEKGDAEHKFNPLLTNDVKAIHFNSFGGDFASAVEIGTEIYDRNLDTIASINCYSACAYMWLAGNNKSVIVGRDITSIYIHSPGIEYIDKVTGEPIYITSPEGQQWASWYLGYIHLPVITSRWITSIPYSDQRPITKGLMDSWGLPTNLKVERHLSGR